MPRATLTPEERSRRNVERVRRWRLANPGVRRREALKKYGLTVEQYEEMYAQQGGKCAVCAEEFPRLSVDHDHESGRVRGLLCVTCNAWLGFVEKYLPAALAYLEGDREQTD